MLVRLLYVSQPVGPITTTITTLILEKSDSHNKKQISQVFYAKAPAYGCKSWKARDPK